jgi:hypothetical protein
MSRPALHDHWRSKGSARPRAGLGACVCPAQESVRGGELPPRAPRGLRFFAVSLSSLAILFALSSTRARAEFVDATDATGLASGGQSWGAQTIDIDGDGDLDLVNCHHQLTVTILTNDGTGHFSASGGVPQIIEDFQDRHGFLWADLDGDRMLDAACSHGGSGGCGCPDNSNELWRSLGAGNLQLVPNAGGMLDPVARGRAYAAADIDLDGDLDLHHSEAPLAASPNSLYRNDGSMSFVDVAADWRIDEPYGTVASLFADYDDDGDPDLLAGGEEFTRPTKLWRNDGGYFSDVTSLVFDSIPVIAGADWGDYDNDGDVDLAVCEGAEGVTDAWGVVGNDFWFFAHHRFGDDGVDVFSFLSSGGNPVAILQWRGTFNASKIFLGRNGAHPAGPVISLTDAYVGAPTYTPGVDEGLYVWRESPGGRWQVHASAPPETFGNFNGTIYTAGGVGSPVVSNLEQLVIPPGSCRLYRNDGGTFADVTLELGFTPSVNPRSVSWTDFDNDGDLDLHQVNIGTTMTGNEADILWRNDGSAFVPLTGAGWVPGSSAHLSDGGVWADLDRDGDLDLFLQEGTGPNAFTNLAEPYFYRNDGPAGHWLELSLGPTLAGGTSVGGKATVYAGSLTVHRRVQTDAWRGFQEPLALHFGLGEATAVDSIVIIWPNGETQVVGSVPIDQAFALTEGQNPLGANEDSGPFFLAGVAGRVFPQPASGMQWLELTLPAPAKLRVFVHDVTGRRVRVLFHGELARGTELIGWDGRDQAGLPMPSGVYFLRGDGDAAFVSKAVRMR